MSFLGTSLTWFSNVVGKEPFPFIVAKSKRFIIARVNEFNLRTQIEQNKDKLMQMKAKLTEEQKRISELEMGAEIPRGQMEQTVTVKVGDDLNKYMGAEILLEDGKIIAFRN